MAGFLIDENLPARLALELSARGLPSQHVSDISALRSAPDHEVVSYAVRERLILVTRDKELFIRDSISGGVAPGFRERTDQREDAH